MLYDIILFQNLLLPSLKFHDQCCDQSLLTLTLSVLKIEKWKINRKENENEKENKRKQSPLLMILTVNYLCCNINQEEMLSEQLLEVGPQYNREYSSS